MVAGVALQLGLGLLLIRAPGSRAAFELLNRAVILLEDATRAGTSLVFGFLGGAPLPGDAIVVDDRSAGHVVICSGRRRLL